jgi:O-antigen ligase
MIKPFYLADNIQNKISYFHLLFFLLLLPFDRFFSTLVLISFLVHTLIYFRLLKWENLSTDILVLQSVFYVTIFSAIYATSFVNAMNVAARQLAIFLFPLLIYLNPMNLARYRMPLMKWFGTGCAVTVAYLFYDALRVIRFQHLPWQSLFSPAFVKQNFSLPINMHATYLSMFLLLSLVHFIHCLVYRTDNRELLWKTVCSFMLMAGLLQLGSKGVLIAAIIIFNIGFFYLARTTPRMKFRFLFISMSFSVLLGILVISSGSLYKRYVTDFRNELLSTNLVNENWRIDRWKASMELIRASPVVGNGSGSEIPLMKEIYFEKHMYVPFLHSMNVHNQFLSFLITSGIFGLVVYLFTLLWGFFRAIRSKDIYLFSFLVLVTAISISEDMLDVNKGIFFYSFFFSFFSFSKVPIKNTDRKGQPFLR